MKTWFVVLLVAVICSSCGDTSPIRPTPELYFHGDLTCLPWLDEGPTAVEENLVDLLTRLGVEGIDNLEIVGLFGGLKWVWNREVVDAYYVFNYVVENDDGEDELGTVGITIDLSDCDFTLMASRSTK